MNKEVMLVAGVGQIGMAVLPEEVGKTIATVRSGPRHKGETCMKRIVSLLFLRCPRL